MGRVRIASRKYLISAKFRFRRSWVSEISVAKLCPGNKWKQIKILNEMFLSDTTLKRRIPI